MSFPSAESAEAAFYAAFEARDLAAMMAVWSTSETIVCIHPLAAPLNGRNPVAAGWKSIFDAAEHFQLQIEPAHEAHDATHAVRVVREFLVIGEETESRPPILATNLYQKEADGWYLVLHHASPLHVGGSPPPQHATSHVLH
jgi:ketosteroid isomerase-like protein